MIGDRELLEITAKKIIFLIPDFLNLSPDTYCFAETALVRSTPRNMWSATAKFQGIATLFGCPHRVIGSHRSTSMTSHKSGADQIESGYDQPRKDK